MKVHFCAALSISLLTPTILFAQEPPPRPPEISTNQPNLACKAAAQFATAAMAYLVARKFLGEPLSSALGAAAAGMTAVATGVGAEAGAIKCQTQLEWMNYSQRTSWYNKNKLLKDWERDCDLGPCGPMPVSRNPGMGISADDLHFLLVNYNSQRNEWLNAHQVGDDRSEQ
ncbi:hypothetical protein V3390_09075 [Luteimonas sp. FXH3W]|uniref:Uncharacterized protein n=1 Tax=Aquilutibacter rugosus TaxID=3115820 RepID=A0ABU7V1G1_9GAMM